MAHLLLNYFGYISQAFNSRESDKRLDYNEVMLISWGMHFIYAFYAIFSIYLGNIVFTKFYEGNNLSNIILQDFNISTQKIAIVAIITEAIFYPFIFHFTFKFWQSLIKFYSEIFNIQNSDVNESEELIKSIYACNAFLIFPVFGKLLSFLSQIFIIFRGLLIKCSYSRLQATTVLLTPLFLLFLVAILIVSYFVFLLSLI
jgi:hypothetical protein